MFPGVRFGVPALVLAPMEGVTDAPMRAVLTEGGAFTYCVSEFLRVSAMVPPRKVFLRHVPELYRGSVTPSGTPIAVQLLGGDPDRMASAARIAWSTGALAVDLNFGCPAKTVNRHDGGATLLKHPGRIETIVRAVRSALPSDVPVSAKLRLGWDCVDDIHATSEAAMRGGASWLTIHARTKSQGYAPPVFWKPAGEVRRRLGIPVIVNGDIRTLDDLRRCRDETQSEHFMIGRGAVADPNFPALAARELGLPGPARPTLPSFEAADWIPLLRRFAVLSEEVSRTDHYAARRIKQWLDQAERRGNFRGFSEIKRSVELESLFSALERLTPSACTP